MAKKKTPSSRKAVVLTADQFEDMEVYFPVFRLQEEGWEVTIAAPTMNTITGEHGYGLEPDTTIDKVDPDEYDLLIIPGGSPDGHHQQFAKSKRHRRLPDLFSQRTNL